MQYSDSPNSQPSFPQQPAQAPQGYYPPQNTTPQGVPTQPYQQAPYPPGGGAPAPKIPDRKSVASKMIEVVYLMLIILESVLALRFVFKMLGADPQNVFINFLYTSTVLFTGPFSSLFGTPVQNRITVQQFSLEFTTLFAMGIYALIAFIVVKIISIFR